MSTYELQTQQVDETTQKPVCCPPFHSALWDGKTFEWDHKKFIRDHVLTLFYVPINFGAVMKRSGIAIDNSDSKAVESMWLADHTSPWNMDLYIAVEREVADVENVVLSGKYISRVYEGAYKEIGTWKKDFEKYVKESNNSLTRTYLWYTTCPKCAKKYGKNYVVFIGQIQ